MTGTRLLIGLVVVAGLGPPSIALADGMVVVRGGATARDQKVVGTSIENTVRDAGWALPGKPAARKDVEAVLLCAEAPEPWDCLPEPQPGAPLQRVFVIGVENEASKAGTPMVVVNAKVIVAASKMVITRQRFCDQCADDKLGSEAAELASQILRELAVRSGRTMASVKSQPTGARIILDGTPIAATDAHFPTFPGAHQLRIEKPGFTPHEAEFTVEEGKTAEISVELQPSAAVPPPVTPGRPSRLLAKITIGTGLAMLATGGLLVAIDEDPSATGKQPETINDTAGWGIGYLLVGAAVTAGGAYWYWRDARPRSAPTASVSATGATVGWTGAF